MSRAALLLVTVALAVAPSAATANECRWSRDGAFFVVTERGEPDMGGVDQVTVYDAHTGAAALSFTLGSDGDRDESAAFAAWAAAHPLADTERAGVTSPDGHGQVVVEQVFKGGKGAWDGDTWRSTLQAQAVMTVVRDGQRVVSTRWITGFYGVDAYFDPTGRRVAWEVTVSRPMFRSPASYAYRFGPASAPRLHLMAVKALLPEVVRVVEPALEKAGFVAAERLPAQTERVESEVFAAKGFEDVARKVAAAVPGGARVSPLTWKADADVVVAAGTRAVGR